MWPTWEGAACQPAALPVPQGARLAAGEGTSPPAWPLLMWAGGGGSRALCVTLCLAGKGLGGSFGLRPMFVARLMSWCGTPPFF